MRILLLSSLVCLFGCAGGGEVPESHLYMLRPTSVPGSFASDMAVGIDAVHVPGYLKRSELMVQIGPQELRPARYHRWAEPLDQNLRRYLRDRLAVELQTNVDANARNSDRWEVSISVVVEEFHGQLQGGALLTASWEVAAGAADDKIQRGRAQLNEAQDRDGYPALVDAQSRLLDALARRIAADVNATTATDD